MFDAKTMGAMAAAGLLAMVAAGPTAGADLPKQGSFAVTTYVAATGRAGFDAGAGKRAAIIEARALAINDAGSGLYHNCAGHCMVLVDTGDRLTGVCVYVDPDGDKFIQSFNREPGPAAKGTSQFQGGTGKYAGIQGAGEFREEPPLADTAPGQRNLISKGKGSYRIP